MYYVYALYNRSFKKTYIGQTQDLERRIELHKNKIFKKSYTAKIGGEWQLIYKEEIYDRKEAIQREKQLKSYQGRLFIKKFIPR